MPQTNRGYPYPDDLEMPDGPEQIEALAKAIDTDVGALAVLVAQLRATSIVTTGATAASGWTVAGLDAEVVGGRTVYLSLTFRGPALTPGSNGNIGDTTIATLPAGLRPRQLAQFVYGDGQAHGEGLINPDGTIVLRTLSTSISSGTNTRLYVSFTLP